MQAGIDGFVEVVRRNIGRHADGNAAGAVDQQIGQARWHDQRFLLAAIVVGAEIDGFLVQIGQQLVGDFGQADFGVAHGGGVVAIDGAEVALAIDQHVAQRKILRHAHDGVINSGVAVRMVFTDHVADDAGGLFEWAVPVVVELVHGEQHAPVYGFESIPGVRQRTAHNHAHRVVKVASAHFLFKTDGQSFFGELGHEEPGGVAQEA